MRASTYRRHGDGISLLPAIWVPGREFQKRFSSAEPLEVASAASTGRSVAYRKLRQHLRRLSAPLEPDGVENTDLGRQLEAKSLGARLWRLEARQASTRHRHFDQEELYLLLEGDGAIRVDGDLLTLAPLDTRAGRARSTRQIFNDTDADQLWFVSGAPPEAANTLEMSPEHVLAALYPDGPSVAPGAQLATVSQGASRPAPGRRRSWGRSLRGDHSQPRAHGLHGRRLGAARAGHQGLRAFDHGSMLGCCRSNSVRRSIARQVAVRRGRAASIVALGSAR